MWIKISSDEGGTYALEATPDPAQVISIAELQSRLDWIKSQGIKTVADKETLDFFNSYKGNSTLLIEMENLQRLINELKDVA